MNILIALIPALFWGILPVIVSKMGGKPANQILGTTLGTLIVATLLTLFIWPQITPTIFIGAFLSGLAWAFGQFLQYTAYTKIGVSKALPISTGLQISATSICGVIIFNEWAGLYPKLIGAAAIIIIITGVFFTSYQQKKDDKDSQLLSGLSILLVSTLGYVGYSIFPRLFDVDGWSGFLPQAIGMVVMSIILSFKGSIKQIIHLSTLKNILPGLLFAVGALAFLISTDKNGVATGFSLSQMSVVIATLGGIYLLGEHKTRKEFIAVIIGLIMVVVGGVMIGFLN